MSDARHSPEAPDGPDEIARAIQKIQHLANTGAITQALAAIDELKARHPLPATAEHLRGRILESHDVIAAEAAYRCAITENFDYYWAHYHLGDLLLRSRRPLEAAAELYTCTQLNPQEPWAIFALAGARTALGSWADAAKLLQSLPSEIVPQAKLDGLQNEIAAARAQEHREASITESSDPQVLSEASTWQARALRALQIKDWTQARDSALEAIARDSSVAYSHFILAQALESLGQLANAHSSYAAALELDNERNSAIPFCLARLYWKRGDTTSAATYYTKALQLEPTRTDVKACLQALGPDGAPSLAAFETQNRKIRIGTFDSHLWLDGHGRNWSHDHARRHHHHYFGEAPFNIGDQFVAQALNRLLRIGEFYTIQANATDGDFDRLNAECEVLLIRGSNFIYPGFFARKVGLDVLRRVKIPIVYIGAGLQFALGEEPTLLPGDIDCLKYIHDSCVSSSVRGPRCAELLASHGIHNVRVTGCPTIVWSRQRKTTVRPPSLERTAWTITDFTWDPIAEMQQLRHIRGLHAASHRFHPVAQGGELAFQAYTAGRAHMYDCNRVDVSLSPCITSSRIDEIQQQQALGQLARAYKQWPAPLLNAVHNDGFFAHNVHEYIRFFGEMGFVAGTRLHGNMMALVQGIPTAFCIHDARLQDMVDHMEAPHFHIGQAIDFAHEPWSWARWEAKYPIIYDAFVDFLEENNLPHQLIDRR